MKKQRTQDKEEKKTTAITVVPGTLKVERKEKDFTRVGGIVQTAYYERKHIGKDADDPKWTEWVRTGTRFYKCVKVEGLFNVHAYLENLTPSSDDDHSPFVSYSINANEWFLNGPTTRHRRDNQDDSWSAWGNVWAEEFEKWHVEAEAEKQVLASTQFAAVYPKQSKPMPWPVIDIVLGYSNREFKDVGFPRPKRRYDASGPVPRLIGSLG